MCTQVGGFLAMLAPIVDPHLLFCEFSKLNLFKPHLFNVDYTQHKKEPLGDLNKVKTLLSKVY